jgi:hypothetical protein
MMRSWYGRDGETAGEGGGVRWQAVPEGHCAVHCYAATSRTQGNPSPNPSQRTRHFGRDGGRGEALVLQGRPWRQVDGSWSMKGLGHGTISTASTAIKPTTPSMALAGDCWNGGKGGRGP